MFVLLLWQYKILGKCSVYTIATLCTRTMNIRPDSFIDIRRPIAQDTDEMWHMPTYSVHGLCETLRYIHTIRHIPHVRLIQNTNSWEEYIDRSFFLIDVTDTSTVHLEYKKIGFLLIFSHPSVSQCSAPVVNVRSP